MRSYYKRRISFYISYYISAIIDIALWIYLYIRISIDALANSNPWVNYFTLLSIVFVFAIYYLGYNNFLYEKKCRLVLGIFLMLIIIAHLIATVYIMLSWQEKIIVPYQLALNEEPPATLGQDLQTQLKCCGFDDISLPAGNNICLHETTCHEALKKWLKKYATLISVIGIFLMLSNLVVIISAIYIMCTIPPKLTKEQLLQNDTGEYMNDNHSNDGYYTDDDNEEEIVENSLMN